MKTPRRPPVASSPSKVDGQALASRPFVVQRSTSLEADDSRRRSAAESGPVGTHRLPLAPPDPQLVTPPRPNPLLRALPIDEGIRIDDRRTSFSERVADFVLGRPAAARSRTGALPEVPVQRQAGLAIQRVGKDGTLSEQEQQKVAAAVELRKAAVNIAAKVNLASGLESKTIAVCTVGKPTMSGWTDWVVQHGKETIQFEGAAGATDKVLNKMAELHRDHGYEIKPHALFDQGVPGRYFASHAEKQMNILYPDQPIGVSRPMCGNCKTYFQTIAKAGGSQQAVADPDQTHLFDTDGAEWLVR